MNDLLPVEVAARIDTLPYVFDSARSAQELEEQSPWSHGRAHPPIVHLVPPHRTRHELMQAAVARVRQNAASDAALDNMVKHEEGVDDNEKEEIDMDRLIECITTVMRAEETDQERYARNEQFISLVRPSSSEDMYPITPLPIDWPLDVGAPFAVLVNSVYKTYCDEGGRDGGLSFIGIQQQLLDFMVPFHVPTHGPLFRIKIRPRERATHRFSPMNTSFQSVGVASDMVGVLTGDVMTQLLAVALGLKNFRARHTQCYNRVYTIYLPFLVNDVAFVDANRQLVDAATKFQKVTVARSPLVNSHKVRLLIFPSGVSVCVGAKYTEQMLASMRYFMPLLYQARMPAKLATPAHHGAASKKRKRATDATLPPPKYPAHEQPGPKPEM